ncbi:MAG: YqcC family protein [Proteobacteria bacterium]|uniref:YqcC family protein n=1 Tax=Candidatus Avisuccinivibrio stercorigallinarum TaxID=2840704 RepID=A0A9D9DDD7_9GAMM|nr:YqcC family protein [Candidatus Avisuccinivibrio stercorigallinarum]
MADAVKIVADKLDEIENELRRLGYWQGAEGRPQEAAFLSTTPFCLDTMELQQWLEYVLLPRLRALIEAGRPLPEALKIAPMAQEFWRGRWAEHRALIGLLKALDDCFGR